MKSWKIPVPLYALASMFFWGMSFIWTTILLESYDPVTIIFLRLIISALFLYSLMIITGTDPKIDRKDLLLLFFSSIFNPFLYFIGENYGLKYSTSTTTSVIISTIPVFTPLAAWLFLRDRISLFTILGILVSFTGVLLVLAGPGFRLIIEPAGILFLGIAVLSALFYSVMLRRLVLTYSPLVIIFFQNLVGVFLFLPLFLVMDLARFLSVVPDTRMIFSLLCLGILASSLSYVFYSKTVREIGISRSNVYTNFIPVITGLFSYFFLDEAFTIQKIAGACIVILGIFVSGAKGVPR